MRNSIHKEIMREASACGRMKPKNVPLTASQEKVLRRGAENGGRIVLFDMRGGLRRAAWDRMMSRLQAKGFVAPYVDGEYRMTNGGWSALQTRISNA